MIIALCAQGPVGYRVEISRVPDQITYRCVNDGAVIVSQRTDQGLIQGLKAIAQHAVSLQGAVQQVVELSEVR